MILVWVLLIISMVFGVALNVFKRVVMVKFGQITVQNALSIGFWFNFFTNPTVLIVLTVNLALFALNMWVLSLIEVNKQAIMSWALIIPSFLLTLFLTNIFLGETIRPEQYMGLALVIISMVIGVFGVYLFSLVD